MYYIYIYYIHSIHILYIVKDESTGRYMCFFHSSFLFLRCNPISPKYVKHGDDFPAMD